MFIALLFFSTVKFDKKIVSAERISTLTINFLSENQIEDINDIKTDKQDERLKNLNINEKVELYNKIKRLREAELKRDILYKNAPNINKEMIAKENNINSDDIDNEFSYHYTPVYVAEDKVNTEEKRRLIENRLKREELRKRMKESGVAPISPDIDALKDVKKVEDIVKISQKPLVVKNKKNEKKEEPKKITTEPTAVIAEFKDKPNNDNQNEYTEEDYNINIDEIITEISIANNAIDDKYKDLTEDQIFNEEDFKKLKEIDESKIDTKYLLSLREKKNIQSQIKGCYKMAILRSKKDSKAVVALTIRVAKDGIINMNDIKVSKVSKNANDKDFDIAIDNAKSALVFCSPLRGLSVAKYKSWRQMTFVFDSNNLE